MRRKPARHLAGLVDASQVAAPRTSRLTASAQAQTRPPLTAVGWLQRRPTSQRAGAGDSDRIKPTAQHGIDVGDRTQRAAAPRRAQHELRMGALHAAPNLFFLPARGWQAELAVDGRARPVHATRAVGAVGAGRRCEPYPLGEQRDAIVLSHVLSGVHSVAKLGRGADTSKSKSVVSRRLARLSVRCGQFPTAWD